MKGAGMKVGELIDLLSKAPQDAVILTVEGCHDLIAPDEVQIAMATKTKHGYYSDEMLPPDLETFGRFTCVIIK